MKLASIPEGEYPNYRREVIFSAYKWDPQVEDHNTIARHALLLEPGEADEIATWTERLSEETMRMEEALIRRPALAKRMGLPPPIRRALGRLPGYRREEHVRVMRFDFHPTPGGWALSEVNSDVPGGFAEASILPQIAARYFDGYRPGPHAGDAMLRAFRSKIRGGGPVALVHCTSYADDRQVMQFLSDHFGRHGIETILAAPDHIRWDGRAARSIAQGREGALSGIVRFFPLEWLANLPRGSQWQGFFGAETTSCNHPVAMLTQSKRLPLAWDQLGVDIPAWRALLPETVDPATLRKPGGEWIFKPALGRVGEGISIREAVTPAELRKIERLARRRPMDWVAQRRFESLPLQAQGGESFHLCLGAFAVDGRAAGFYARISPHPRIDARARDIPILIASTASREGMGR